MKHIFEGNWLYLAHESQIPQKNDYITLQMGRQPVFIARNKDGVLNAFLNACSHRGAMLCRHKRGNKSSYTCPFHGWTFNNSGKLLKVKDPGNAGYPASFNCEGSHDLTKVARFESYRGFLFGSLNADVVPLAEHLGESAKIIDMIVDQSPDGLEVLRGSSSYIYEGNWKLTAENGADGYHVSSVHWNYAATQNQRKERQCGDTNPTMSAGGWAKSGGGFYSFDKGHMLLWTRWANPQDRPLYERRDELVNDFGQARADWMIGNSRNLCLYPNVYLMDQFSSQIRIARPISVNQTEITIYCIAPVGESAEARSRRIRQYEDFFNVSGMATPMTWRNSVPARWVIKAALRPGTICRVVPNTGSKGRMKRRWRLICSRCSAACAPKTKGCLWSSTSTGKRPCCKPWPLNRQEKFLRGRSNEHVIR